MSARYKKEKKGVSSTNKQLMLACEDPKKRTYELVTLDCAFDELCLIKSYKLRIAGWVHHCKCARFIWFKLHYFFCFENYNNSIFIQLWKLRLPRYRTRNWFNRSIQKCVVYLCAYCEKFSLRERRRDDGWKMLFSNGLMHIQTYTPANPLSGADSINIVHNIIDVFKCDANGVDGALRWWFCTFNVLFNKSWQKWFSKIELNWRSWKLKIEKLWWMPRNVLIQLPALSAVFIDIFYRYEFILKC